MPRRHQTQHSDQEMSDMPHVIRRPKRIVAKASTVLAAAIAILAVPAVASAACPSTPTTKAFQAFGDSANYSLAPNGAFETGTSGWTLSGASTATGNESYKVHGAADTKSLVINPTGTAVSPAFCVSVDHPTFRFFLRRTSGTWGSLGVRLRWRDATGHTNDTTVASIDQPGAWKPTQPLQLASTLPLWQSGQTLSVQIVFDPEDFGGAFAIDDVYIDPYTRG
jgi:hypothetical protein